MQVVESTTAAPTNAPVQPPKAPPALKTRDFGQAEYKNLRMSAVLQDGQTFDDCLRPEFWASVAYIFRKETGGIKDKSGAIIEVRTVDHEFYAELYVRAVLDNGLIVGVLRQPVYLSPKTADPDKFEIKWNVGEQAYNIIRQSDRSIVARNLKVKEQAFAWIAETTKAN